MKKQELADLSSNELSNLYYQVLCKYKAETKPLYKRHLGGQLLTILQEINRRKNANR